MGLHHLDEAIQKLQDAYSQLDFSYHDFELDGHTEKLYHWPGPPEEDILICVHRSSGEQELFHRHDYFYFNYTYKGKYESLSSKYDHKITIRENELYAGQPYAGHALCVHDNEETLILGVLVKRETFFRAFLPMLSTSSKLFHFFLDPTTRHFSDGVYPFPSGRPLYGPDAAGDDGARVCRQKAGHPGYPQAAGVGLSHADHPPVCCASSGPACETLSERIVQYMSAHLDVVTLKDVAAHFNYHPNYISTVIHRERGKTFSKILLEQRMDRAAALLRCTSLSVEEIALMLGYSNSSNFHKAFRSYYHCSPRAYIEAQTG